MSAGPGESSPLGTVLPWRPSTVAWFLALLGWTTLLAFYDLGAAVRFEPTDGWVAQTAREMYTGPAPRSLIIPRFSGETRMQKSPGPYWAVMLTTWLRGQAAVDEVSTRIPNGCAALLIVVTVFWFTRRVAGERAGVFAGFASAASILILYWSHRGASDLGLAALTTLSLATLWVAAEQEPPGRRRILLWFLGYFAAGLGMLYKLPMPLAIVGVPVFLYVLVRRRWRVLVDRVHLWGLLLFLLPWLPWAIAVVILEPTALAKWKVEFLDRFTGDLPNVEGQRAWYFHFVYLVPPLVYCLPFSLSLPQAVARVFRRQPGLDRNAALFLGLWFAGLFVFFTVSAGKEYRYFLPALPPLLMLLGVELADFFNPSRPATPVRDRNVAMGVWILLPLALASGVFALRAWHKRQGQFEGFTWAEVWQPYIVAVVIFSLGAAVAAWLYVRRREHASFGALVGTMWLTWAWIWSAVLPVFVAQRPFLDFAAQLRTQLDPALIPRLRQVGSHDARIIWYSDVRFPRVIDQLALLREQKGRRDLDYEIRRTGEEVIRLLDGEVPVLFVATVPDFALLLLKAPGELAAEGRAMPPVHVWLQARCGTLDRQFVLFGNQPPPFPEPELRVPEKLRARLAAAQAVAPPASRPSSAPTTVPMGPG